MGDDFLDTNVFVYLFDETNRHKREIAEKLLSRALIEGGGIISSQVVQECLNVITTKLRVPASPEDAQRFLEKVLVPLWRVSPTPELYNSAIKLRAGFNLSFYDSLVVAAARSAGCTRLLSEDMQHGLRIGDTVIENPFLTTGDTT